MDHLMNTYRRLPVTFSRGEGVYLYDTEGNRYLDALGGIAVCVLGHSYPSVVEAIQTQAAKLIHTGNLYQIENQQLLGDLLCRLTGLDKAFFCNSGAEAVECALKLIRLYGHQRGFELPKIVVMNNAFHGRTFATLSAGGNKKVHEGFEPLMPGFLHVPFNDTEILENLAQTHKDIAAVMLEPIQGEGGIYVPHADYLKKVRAICDKHHWLMVLDEVQSGMGRTGTLFAYQAKHITPDILTVAKGLANGVPIGACLAKAKIADLFQPGNHGSTFGGNPLATAAGLATLEAIESKKLWNNAKHMGEMLLNGLKEKLKGHPHVVEIRGQGLMLGIELDRACRPILNLALNKRLLFNVTRDKVIRLLPPLIIEESHVREIIRVLPELINEFTLEKSETD